MAETPSPRSRRRPAGAARDGAPSLAVTPTTDAPVFLVGAPRSGTTLLYKALCLHPAVSYISNWHRRVPGVDAVAALNRVPRAGPRAAGVRLVRTRRRLRVRPPSRSAAADRARPGRG